MKITIGNEEYEINEKTRIIDYFGDKIRSLDFEAIACRYKNEIKSLNHEINKDGEIEFIGYTDKDGRYIYIRGLLFIMAMAIKKIYPNAWLTVNYQLSNAMYCQIDNMEVTDEFIKNVHEEMKNIINQNIPIKKVVMTKEEAEEFYAKEQSSRGKLQMDTKYKDTVSLYYCGDYYNYFYGTMPISTGVIKLFDIQKYKDGFIVRYPSKNNPNEMEEFHETQKLLETMRDYDEIYRLLNINTIAKLNRKILEGKAKECILLSEALHEKKISDIADQILARKNVRMVLIAGPSSSGKTTFAQRLGIQLRLNGFKPVTISVDNYFVERENNPKDEFGNYDFETIDALDLDLFNSHLLKLLAGEEIAVPTFDFNTGSKKYLGNKMKLEDDEILVIEGIHCLNDRLTQAIDKSQKFKIYISDLTVLNVDYCNRISTTDTRLIRRIVRDYQFRGYSALHTLKMWYSVNRGEEKNIFPYQEEADCMFNSSLVYELSVLKDFAIPLLKEIDSSNREYSEAKRLLTMLNYFESIPAEEVPNSSLLKEFTGGSIFEV